MNEKKQKKTSPIGQILVMLGFLLIGALCGIMMVRFVDITSTPERSAGEELLLMGLLFLGMYLLLYLHIVLHEAGHLVFGLLTGYGFSSFRIGSLMWVRESGHLRFRRLSIAGTGGQCLMTPPEMKDGNLPVVLYHLGGSLANAIVALFSLIGFLWLKTSPFSVLCLMSALIGAVYALMNGLPVRMGLIDNDGCNALALRKNAGARRAFWVQMKVNEQIAAGVRLRDMPEEWFAVPADEEMDNSMTAAIGVFACNRLMDAHRFTEAEDLMSHLLSIDSAMVGVHRHLMVCDRLYLELIGECRSEEIERMLTAEQKKFMKSMKKFPTVLRTEYVLAKLWQNDAVRTETICRQFEKCARSYPYPNDVESERELMRIADEKHEKSIPQST